VAARTAHGARRGRARAPRSRSPVSSQQPVRSTQGNPEPRDDTRQNRRLLPASCCLVSSAQCTEGPVPCECERERERGRVAERGPGVAQRIPAACGEFALCFTWGLGGCPCILHQGERTERLLWCQYRLCDSNIVLWALFFAKTALPLGDAELSGFGLLSSSKYGL
jgi:hypothetical protein